MVSEAKSSMEVTAHECLVHPLEHNYREDLRHAINDPASLGLLNTKQKISFAERQVEGSYLVLVTQAKRHELFKRSLRQFHPSFFVDFAAADRCKAQVHILDVTIAGQKLSLLLTFFTLPTDEKLQCAIKKLAHGLDLKHIETQWTSTAPYRYSQTVSPAFLATF